MSVSKASLSFYLRTTYYFTTKQIRMKSQHTFLLLLSFFLLTGNVFGQIAGIDPPKTLYSARATPSADAAAQAMKARTQKLRLREMDLMTGKFASSWTFNLGYGLSGTFNKDAVVTHQAPLSFGIGYRAGRRFSIELLAGRSKYASDMNYFSHDYRTRTETSFSVVGLRPKFHQRISTRLEAYGGTLIGYQMTNLDPQEARQSGSDEGRAPIARPKTGLFVTGFVGTRYSFSPHVGAFGELGMGLSLFTVGISFRL